ncbi:MAG: hypothetical protein ACI82Z_000010 [Cellvibrionaceae bacterium]|jgi:hypothetical protein
MDSHQKSSDKELTIFEKPKNIRAILYALYGICMILVLLDFVVHRHTEVAIEKLPGFYAFYGFTACVLLVLLATQMRKLVMRKENYYLNSQQTPSKQVRQRR